MAEMRGLRGSAAVLRPRIAADGLLTRRLVTDHHGRAEAGIGSSQKPGLCSTFARGGLPLVTPSTGFLNLCQVRIQPARIATTSADVLRLCKRSANERITT